MDSSPGLQECLAILKNAKSDNEMFASLLVITRMVKASETSSEERHLLFNAVGFNFLDRLVKSEAPDGCPEHLYRSIALTILSCFVTDKEFAVHPRMLDKISFFGEVLGRHSTGNAEEMEMVSESLHCLEAIVVTDNGVHETVLRGAAPVLIDLVQLGSSSHSKRALSILVRLLQSQHGDLLTDKHGGQLARLLRHLGRCFASTQEADKFELCSVLVTLLSHLNRSDGMPGSLQAELCRNDSWQRDIGSGLFDILKSRVHAHQRHTAISLAACLAGCCGLRWTYGSSEGPEQHSCLLLLAKLVSVEVRLQLEDLPSPVVERESLQLLCDCFEVVEAVLNFMVLSGEDELSNSTILQLHGSITDTLRTVLNFLSLVTVEKDKWLEQRLTVFSMVRIVACWLAEETQMLREEVYACVPLLVAVAKWSAKNRNSSSGLREASHDSDRLDLLSLLMPAFSNLMEDEGASSLVKESGVADLFLR